MAKTLKWITLLIVVCGIVWLVIWFNRNKDEIPVAKIEEAKIIDVRPMLKLCSVEIYEEIPVKARIGSRHIFAKETLTGSITFDLEKAESYWDADTLVVTLPPEKVEIYESTAKDSYKVIDTWNDKFLHSSQFSTTEENEIKRGVVESWRDSIYSRGYVKRAREEAVRNLEQFLVPFVVDKQVRVVDPSPDGNKRSS